MNVAGIPFLYALLALTSFIFLLPTVRAAQCLLAACSVGFLAWNMPSPIAWMAMAAFLLSGYLMAALVRGRAATPRRSLAISAYMVLVVVVFCYLKGYPFLTMFLPAAVSDARPAILGLSYMLFRQIHFIIDSSEGEIASASLWDYANYQLNFFAIIAGPIQRFQDFLACWTTLSPLAAGWTAPMLAYGRILWGMIKVGLIGAFLLQATTDATAHQLSIRQPADILHFAVLFYGYPAYVYFNFTGYCDIVIAGASLVGMRLPENFNRPYIARNMIDYWNRWHMTLGHWIRDYLFMPMLKTWLERWPDWSVLATNTCYFIALTLAGIWHGSTWNFIVFGVLNGAGVAAAKAWENEIIRRRGRKGLKQYLQNRFINVIAVIVTLHFVFITFLFFNGDLHERLSFLRHFFTAPAAVASAAVIP